MNGKDEMMNLLNLNVSIELFRITYSKFINL